MSNETITSEEATDVADHPAQDGGKPLPGEVLHTMILASAMDGFWQTDCEGRILEVNDAYCQMSGYSEAELLTMSIWALEAVESPDDVKAHIEKLRTQGEGRFETRHRRKDGSLFDVEASVRYRAEAGGRCIGFFRDITDRKRAEEALRSSRKLLQLVLDTIPVRVFWKDRDLRFLGCNRSFCRDAGVNGPEELLGLDDFSMPWREQAQAYRADDLRTIESAEPRLDYEESQTSPEGKRLTLKTSKIPLRDGTGQIIGVLGTYEDVTARKTLESQLLQAQKMESVGRLAGGVAHDFNNMLQVIQGYTDLVIAEAGPEDPERELLAEIQKAASRAADLTRRLLAFARRQTVSPKVLDLNDAVGGMLKMLRRLIGEDIDLAWVPGHDLRRVKVDPSQIDQILANLCVNARDAIADVGHITIATLNRELDEAYCATHLGAVPGPYVLLSVRDTGHGMDSEILSHIFEPFFTTKGLGEGTGLGLATVYGIVKQNNGFIDVRSAPGEGTTFDIYIPSFEAERGGMLAVREDATPPRGTETVLLVEDEEAVLKLGKRILEGLGYSVVTAGTPTEALDRARNHTGEIHLLITDVVMPEMNGRDLAEALACLRPGLKRLFMSGYTSVVIAPRGILEEGVCFIQKPFTPDALGMKVREALKG
ncbi:MAG: PAS domain S-box protein [Candidatus Riflebacteria bacterium]|nr:PAS domain S-box protein [Candidatus Riflebacteria bacterium]